MIDAALRRDAAVIIDAALAALDHADHADDAQPTVSTMAAATLLATVVATLAPADELPADLLADLRRHVEADGAHA